jgi:hypothetical protein
LQLLREIFERDELRSARPLLQALGRSLETAFNAAHDDQLAGVFLAILKRYPNSDCGATDEHFRFSTVDGRAQEPDESSKLCGHWADRLVFDSLAECLEVSGRFEEIFLRIMLRAGEEERYLCLVLFFWRDGYGCRDKVVHWFLSFYAHDINATWRLVLKLVSFMMAQVRPPCHGRDLIEAPFILMTEELEEYFCAFMHSIRNERPDWYEHKNLPSEWLCKSCKLDRVLRCQLDAMLRPLRFNVVDGAMG